MRKKKENRKNSKETITIRPSFKYRGLSLKLKAIADQENRSLNNFILMSLDKVVKDYAQ